MAVAFGAIRSALAAVLVLATLAVAAPPANARPLEQVLETGRLVVFVYENFPPYSFRNGDELVGIDVEIGKLLAEELGVTAQFLVREADENVDDDLRVNVWKGDLIHRQAADVMLHVPVDQQLIARNPLVMLCCAYFQERIALVVDDAEVASDNVTEFRTHKIAVEVDTVGDFFLSNAFRGMLAANVIRGRYFNDAAEAFLSGEAVGLMATRAQAEWVGSRSERAVRIIEPPMPGLLRQWWNIGYAVKHDSRDLGYELEAVFQKARGDGRLQAIFEKYGVTYLAPRLD